MCYHEKISRYWFGLWAKSCTIDRKTEYVAAAIFHTFGLFTPSWWEAGFLGLYIITHVLFIFLRSMVMWRGPHKMDATGRLTYRLLNRDARAKVRHRGLFHVDQLVFGAESVLQLRHLRLFLCPENAAVCCKKEQWQRGDRKGKEPPGSHRQEGVLAQAGGPDRDRVSRAFGQTSQLISCLFSKCLFSSLSLQHFARKTNEWNLIKNMRQLWFEVSSTLYCFILIYIH